MSQNSPNRHNLISSAKNTILLGIIINLLLSLTKGLAGYLGNSYALIADAIESFSDVLGSLVVYTGIKIALLVDSISLQRQAASCVTFFIYVAGY